MLDIASSIESILKSIEAHTITNLFLYLILAVFILSVVFAVIGKARAFTQHAPNLLTSLGILGTFIGIVIGLLHFDSKNIDGSIELLLAGLQTAFVTSLFGMSASIVYKIIGATSVFKENRGDIDEILDVEPRDILNAIVNQKEYFNELTGQIKLLRNEENDNSKQQQQNFEKFTLELWKNLNEFSEMLSKSATEQVIQALKEVITDFNNNLTEQFGDNFKALDSSVKKLVDWQSNYSSQLEHMIVQYSQGVKAISDIEASVADINNETKTIPESMAKLSTIMEVNQHQLNELEQHLGAFKEMKDQAVQAIPMMQKHVEKTIEEIALSAQKASEGYNTLLSNTENVQDNFTKSIEDMQNRLDNSITQLIEKQISEMNKSFSSLESQVEKSVGLTGEAVNKKLKMIDDSMSQEVERVMQQMGKALASISGQFTNDYQELTRAMKNITRQAA